MYLSVEKLLVSLLLCSMMSLDNHRCISTTDGVPGVEDSTAMFGRPISYSRHTLYTYRRSVGGLKSTFIDRLAECGLLRYRGSRGGQATRARRIARLKSKQPEVNNSVEIPAFTSVNSGTGYIPTIIGNRIEDKRYLLRVSPHHGHSLGMLDVFLVKPHWSCPNILNSNHRSITSKVVEPSTVQHATVYNQCNRQRVLRHINCRTVPSDSASTDSSHSTLNAASLNVPSMYVLNTSSLAKPYAVEQLSADINSYNSDVAIISETHFKSRHLVSAVSIPGYTLMRRDRIGKRCGGVAIYVRESYYAHTWVPSADDRKFELLWARVGASFFGAIYHPPRTTAYTSEALLSFIESCVEEITRDHPAASIFLAGDFNTLPDDDITERTGLSQIVRQPTRGGHILDRIYESCPTYSTVRVVNSVVKTDHRAVVAYKDLCSAMSVKVTSKRSYRRRTPTQNALFLQYIASTGIDNLQPVSDTQQQFDAFYVTALQLLDQFYPERVITTTSRDPDYVTPEIKALLRRKNRLMRAGRVEEAAAVAKKIGDIIKRRCKSRLSNINGRVDPKKMWAEVRKLTGNKQAVPVTDGFTADSFNQHYTRISTDSDYLEPRPKQSVNQTQADCLYITEWHMFKILDGLHHTSTGLDKLPAWFLRLGAPVFSEQLARLFNLSIYTSTVPQQWKRAVIRPVPKIGTAGSHTDFRPICITPVLTRIMEKSIVRHFLYPAFNQPPVSFSLNDQFAFRPTGSTTAALVFLLHTVTQMLNTNSYVTVIATDFSKAFDTVRHVTLLEKLAALDLPDQVYNWLVNFFCGRTQCTTFNDSTSVLQEISASIVQGSAIGPACYVINASDLKAVNAGNVLCKYADDTYIIIPACNVDTRNAELENVEKWAKLNNLTLNRAKSAEMVLHDSRRKRKPVLPSLLADVKRVQALKVLGVTMNHNLSVSDHVTNVIRSSAQTVHALRLLRAHGMADPSLHIVFRAVIVAKLTYAASAWWGFASASDRSRLEAVLRRGKRSGLCPVDVTTVADLVGRTDDDLFEKAQHPHHVLNNLLPKETVSNYEFRHRRHNLELINKSTHLADSDFIIRMLYKDMY